MTVRSGGLCRLPRRAHESQACRRRRLSTIGYADLWRRRGRPSHPFTTPGRTHDDALRLHADDRAERTQGPRPLGRGRRAGRLRLRGLERPLLPLAHRAGPRPVCVVGARRRRPGHRAGRPHDLRDLPDDPLPPRGRRPEGRDPAAPRRRPLHARRRQRREPQRARRRGGLARRSSRARRCSSRRSTSSASCTPATS